MEKKNTPMQDLIEKLRNQQKFNPKESDYDKGFHNGIAAAIDLAKRLSPKEKQAIMDAHKDMHEAWDMEDLEKSAEDYFTQTFNTTNQ